MKSTFTHIESRPDVLNGKPCLKGTRISVQLVLEWLAGGASVEEIAAHHPLITKEGVVEAIQYVK